MVSTDDLSKFSFFDELSESQLKAIATVSQFLEVESGFLFFAEGDQVDYLYFLEEGQVDICYDVVASPKFPLSDPNAAMLADDYDVPGNELDSDHLDSSGFMSVCGLRAGDVFGWTSFVPPHITHAGALARTCCSVLAVDARKLELHFEEDPNLGYRLVIKIAQTIRNRVRDLRLKALKLSDRVLQN